MIINEKDLLNYIISNIAKNANVNSKNPETYKFYFD